MIPILYDDKHIIVCQKPVGLLSQIDKSNETCVQHELNHMYPNQIIYVVHRLDRDVGGVMVYAKTKPAAAALSAAISSHDIIKEYYAVVDGALPEEQGTLKDFLFRDKYRNKSYVVSHMRRGVKEAVLDYQVLQTAHTFSLVKIQLQTGRTHQIRVQFASRRLPLLGDTRYGSKHKNCHIALWAGHIQFPHPITKERLDFTCPPPSSYPWTLFESSFI